jgi:hypothetical protein
MTQGFPGSPFTTDEAKVRRVMNGWVVVVSNFGQNEWLAPTWSDVIARLEATVGPHADSTMVQEDHGLRQETYPMT